MIAIQVCSALDYAHMRGLIHRDIKPSNIMVKRNGEVKLMDFGIAHTRSLESLTMPGMLIGTPAYMSPEQILGQNLDIRSDIFSFGIVLYELFTGMKPFTDDDTRAVSAKIVKDKIVPPRRINRAIPRSIQRVIKKCLNKKPQKRFGSMLEVEKKLGKRLAGRTTKPVSLLRISDYLVSLKVIEPAPEQETIYITANPTGRRWFKPALAAAVLLLAASGAAFYYHWTKTGLTDPVPAAAPAAPSSHLVSPQPTAAVPNAAQAVADQGSLKSSVSGSQAAHPRATSKTTTRSSSPSASLEQKKEQTSSARKKKTAVKTTAKKKKKTTASH
jgi:serine/threonine-protein kinase